MNITQYKYIGLQTMTLLWCHKQLTEMNKDHTNPGKWSYCMVNKCFMREDEINVSTTHLPLDFFLGFFRVCEWAASSERFSFPRCCCPSLNRRDWCSKNESVMFWFASYYIYINKLRIEKTKSHHNHNNWKTKQKT